MCSLLLMFLEICTTFTQLQVIFWGNKKSDNFIEKILHKFKEEGNQVYAIDYNRDGSKFATGGKDCQVIVYRDFNN